MTDRDQHPSDRPERTQKRLEHAGSTRRETLKTVGTVGLAGLTGTGVASVSSAHGSRGNEFERSTADSVAPGETIWQFEVEAAPDYGISSSPTVVDGTVVFGTDGGNVYALDAATGSQQWSYDLIGSTSASAAIYDGTVFIVNSGGDFVALDLQTGQKQWEFNGDAAYLDNQLMSSPLLSEGTLYVGMGDGNLYALDADSGEMEWTFQTGNPIKTSPVRSGERICIGSASTLYGINAETGEEQWVFDGAEERIWTATASDGALYFGSDDESLYSVDAEDGARRWKNDRRRQVRSTPTVHEDTLVVSLRTVESLGLFDLDTGEELMTTGSRLANASPTVVGTTVYYATMTASVAAIDIDTEEESWRRDFDGFPRIESSPTVVDGVLFVGTENGTFYALNAGTDGSSEGSRVTDRSLGYHDGIETYDDQGPLSVTPTRPGDDTTAATQEPDSPTPDGATATETTTTDTDAGESGGLPLAALAGGGAVAAVGSYVFGTRILGTNDGDDTGDTNSD